jgi:hypothetical protein
VVCVESALTVEIVETNAERLEKTSIPTRTVAGTNLIFSASVFLT